MNNIYFSILIPVYNAENYLEQSLESVLKQSYENYEIILINDGSTDSSKNICDNFAKKDNRVKVFHQKNMGIAKTRYETLKKIKGDFTLFLDSDDYLEPNFLQIIIDKIKHFDPDIIMFNYKNVDEENNFISNNKTIFKNNEIFTTNKQKLYDRIFFTDDINNLWTKVIKSSLIKLDDYSNYLDMNNGEDNMFLIPLLIRSKKILNINNILYNYRDNSKSITNTFKKSKIKDEFTRYNYTLKYLDSLNLNTDKNLNILRIYFFKKVIVLILQLGFSNTNLKEKLITINKIRTSNEIVDIFSKTSINNFKNSSKNLYNLLKFKFYKTIFIYSNIYGFIKSFKNNNR